MPTIFQQETISIVKILKSYVMSKVNLYFNIIQDAYTDSIQIPIYKQS